jgi:hypothetical protein
MLIILICTVYSGAATAEKGSAPESKGVGTTQSSKGGKDKQDQTTSGQTDSSLSEACDEPDNAWRHSAGDSPLRRFIKLFYGPDRPPGPDPDVDTNISAGGAGGG